jgi:spore germination protein GerM
MTARKARSPLPDLAIAVVLALAALCGCRKESQAPSAAQVPAPLASQSDQVQRILFYPAGDDQLLTGVKVSLVSSGNPQQDMTDVIRRLLLGPPGEGQTQPFPERCGVRSTFMLGSEAVVDLTGPVRTGAGSDTETARVYGIVQSLHANFPEVRSVRILVDGQEVESLLGHVDLRHSLVPEARLLAPADRAALGNAS